MATEAGTCSSMHTQSVPFLLNQMQFILSQPHEKDKVFQLPARIIDNLLLGSFEDACNISQLKAKGVTHIINCAGKLGMRRIPKYDLHGIVYEQVDAR
jgi:hypothetical protein